MADTGPMPIPQDVCRKTLSHQLQEFAHARAVVGDALLAALPDRLRWREVPPKRITHCQGCGQPFGDAGEQRG